MRAVTRTRFEPIRILYLLASLLLAGCLQATEISPSRPLPEFAHRNADQWINSTPLSIEDLRGKVLLVDIWTFECWNCYRSFPWLNALEQKFSDGELRLIGIHTPEFDRERRVSSVRAKVEEFKLRHPIMVDNDMRYWRALDNHYWPAYYLVDRRGNIRFRFVGETHENSKQAKAIEAAIKALLAEPA